MRGTAGFYSGWPDGPLSQGKIPDNGLSFGLVRKIKIIGPRALYFIGGLGVFGRRYDLNRRLRG